MGAQLRVYRSKIKSAQTTKKITRAMELISASRIQKAQQRVAASGPYSRAVTRAVSAVATFSNVDHILTTEPAKIERAAIVIFSSDRGLAGAFNSNVLRASEELATLLRSQGKDIVYYLVGRKSVGYFRFRRRDSERQWIGGTDNPEFETAKEIGDAVVAGACPAVSGWHAHKAAVRVAASQRPTTRDLQDDSRWGSLTLKLYQFIAARVPSNSDHKFSNHNCN